MAENKILATVAGNPITENDVNEIILSMGQNAKAYDSPRGREAILEQLINKKLLLLDAQRNLFERESAFKEQLAKLKEELMSNYCIEKITSSVKVTDADAKAFFEEHRSDLVADESIGASHILVENEDDCKRILNDIKDGKITFEDAAVKYSTCPSKEAGGNLGEFTRGQMVPEFENAAFEMEIGEIKGPVKTQFGYHIIKLNERHESAEMKYEDIEEQIKEQLLREKQQKAYQSKIAQLKIMYMVDKF